VGQNRSNDKDLAPNYSHARATDGHPQPGRTSTLQEKRAATPPLRD
jgi:hypothetical protein